MMQGAITHGDKEEQKNQLLLGRADRKQIGEPLTYTVPSVIATRLRLMQTETLR